MAGILGQSDVDKEDAVSHTSFVNAVTIGLLVIAVPKSPNALGAPGQAGRAGAQKLMLAIPQSLQTEHEEIHKALTNATRAPGRVGAAAKELAAVLDPHFERENQIALPPLGLLAPLAAGQTPAGLQEALAMTDALRKASPRPVSPARLGNHRSIRFLVSRVTILGVWVSRSLALERFLRHQD